jgi:hypothetical protein
MLDLLVMNKTAQTRTIEDMLKVGQPLLIAKAGYRRHQDTEGMRYWRGSNG